MDKATKDALRIAAIDHRDASRAGHVDGVLTVAIVREYVSAHSGVAAEDPYVQKIVVKQAVAA